MLYKLLCSYCNKEVVDGASFCPYCGKSIGRNNEEDKRKIKFEGTIYKCPNCGEVLNSFEAYCQACGYEIRNRKRTGAVEELTRKLEELESKRDPEVELQIKKMRAWHGAFLVGLSPVDEQKISLIKNFAIPNTKEDLYEFLIMAKANMKIEVPINNAENAIARAWRAKYEQAYEKAKIIFKNDDRFKEIEGLCKESKKNYKKEGKSIDTLLFLIVFGIILSLPILIFICISVLRKFG